MSAQANRQNAAPAVDNGDASGFAALVARELRPTPGRLADSVRMVAVVLIIVGIAETFRLPDIALSAFIGLFLSRHEAVSTVLSAVISGIAAMVAITATIAIFMLSLSEPALRIPLMAIATFAAAFFARTATLGPVFFAVGFIITYGLTFGDEVLGLALQPATSGNATQAALPEIVFVSPEEALVKTLLWLSVAAGLPLAVLIAANLLTGRDPARILNGALAARLAAAASFCAREKRAERQLEAQAFEGVAGLHKLHNLAGFVRHRRRIAVPSVALIDESGQLVLLLLACLRLGDTAREALKPAAAFCRSAANAVGTGEAPPVEAPSIVASAPALPLADAISHTLHEIAGALGQPAAAAPSKAQKARRPPRRLLVGDAFSNPEHVRFALKLTLAVMVCYFIENGAAQRGLGRCSDPSGIRASPVRPWSWDRGRSRPRPARNRASAVRPLANLHRTARGDVRFARSYGLAADHEAACGGRVRAPAALAYCAPIRAPTMRSVALCSVSPIALDLASERSCC
jgi:multidrug resistance protein MdtO